MPVALVTGASGGIGGAIAGALAGAGFDVIGVGRSSALEDVGSRIAASGRQYLAIPTDLESESALRSLVDTAWDWRGGVDALVNAAGVIDRTPENELTAAGWDHTFSVNVRAPFYLTEHLGRRMFAATGGSIVNVASIAGVFVTGAPASYQASKAAMLQLTRYYANRLAPRVRVNAMCPGYVRTELSRDWLEVNENEQWVRDRTPLARIADPEDLTGLALFLLSDASSYITGQHILVDGGWSVG